MSTTSDAPTTLGSVLVTGGCGFLGSHIVRSLLDDPGCTAVAVVSRNPTVNHHPKASYHAIDITDAASLSYLIAEIQPRVIIHTASPSNRAKLEILKRHKHHRHPKPPPLRRHHPNNRSLRLHLLQTEATATLYTARSSVYAYAKSKAMADALVPQANSPKLRTACIRIPSIYGERDTNLIPRLLAALRKSQHTTQM